MNASDLKTPEAIDGSFVARGVEAQQVAVGDELVLVAGTSLATVLNPTGALIWACLDGESTLDELITDLSEELGVDRDVVEADVLGFARTLGHAGLLEGVGYPPAEIGRDSLNEWGPPVALEVGDAPAEATFTELDGGQHELTEYRGRDVLLVNWSPTCGYCTTIVDRLATWKPSLHDRDVQLVFLTRGDADANRAVFHAAGLDAPTLVLADGADPFAGYGTPAAYHLDTDGRLTAPMALGAVDVPILAATLAGVDPDASVEALALDVPSDDEPSDRVPEGTRYLPAPGGT